jgi:hypothetical protein
VKILAAGLLCILFGLSTYGWWLFFKAITL